MKALIVLGSLCALAIAPARAQTRPGECRVDTAAAWHVKQRAWFNDSRHDWSNDSLRTVLLRAADLTDPAKVGMQYGWVITNVFTLADSTLVGDLTKLASVRGSTWPTRSVVGGVGTRAVWVIALRDSALARMTLKRMMEAGPEESNAPDVAMLEDRMRLLGGRKQLYGTHFRIVNGKAEVLPTEDLAHIDMRREDAGLPPFEVSACLAARSAR